jgi:hypothetical protein
MSYGQFCHLIDYKTTTIMNNATLFALISMILFSSCSRVVKDHKRINSDTSSTISFIKSTNENPGSSIFQKSYQHWESISDSVVLTSMEGEAYDIFNKISIYRENKLVFNYADENLQVIGMPYYLFVEQEIVFHKEYYYIFKLFGGYHYENYLIIKTTPDTTYIFGKTKTNSAIILGDIDFDGKIEIGGFSDLCEEYEYHECPDTTLFEVFEIREGFPIDVTLTRYFRKLLIKK